MINVLIAIFVFSVFGFAFWGYPLDSVNFNTLHFLSKEPFPDFWGLRIVDPQTAQIDFSFFYRNEGLMVALLYFFYRLPVSLETKLVLINSLNVSVQLLNVGLFVYVVRKLAGPSRFLPYLFLYLLYPFAAANHYWAAGLPVNLSATFFLASLSLFLNVNYVQRDLTIHLIRWIVPSLLCLWCSIIMVEYAIFLSPLYLYLALYYSHGRTTVVKFHRWIMLYPIVAGAFLATSVLPALLFTGHRLTVASYANRYEELAAQVHLPIPLVTLLVMVGNGVLVCTSYLFANTLGIVAYPLAELATNLNVLAMLPVLSWVCAVVIALLAGAISWIVLNRHSRKDGSPDYRFLMVLGLLWAGLSYLPFMLSVGYPRNVGLHVDRMNVLGSMGVILCLGTAFHLLHEKVHKTFPKCSVISSLSVVLLAFILLLNLHLQKASYVEADRKERAIVEAVLNAGELFRNDDRKPIFLLDRAAKDEFPMAQLRRALHESSWRGKLNKVMTFLFERHFARMTSSSAFHLNGIYLFWCCPSSAPVTFDFYADWFGRARPVVYKREEPFRLSEDAKRYTIGYANTEAWGDASRPGEFRFYPKQAYKLVILEIEESTFRLGGPLAYSLKPYTGMDMAQGLEQRGM